MNLSTRSLIACIALAATPLACIGQTVTASALPSCDGVQPSALQQRIAAKAQQGVGALRDYLFITRGIYNLSMEEAMAMLDRQRADQGNCAAVASAAR